MNDKTKVMIYVRIKNNGQNYDNLLTKLHQCAEEQGYALAKTFIENTDWVKKFDERILTNGLFDYVKTHHIKKVLIYSASHISRRIEEFLSFAEQLSKDGVSLYVEESGMETLLPDGTLNPEITIALCGLMRPIA